MSFGTKDELSCCCGKEDTIGCLPALITNAPSWDSNGRVNGCGFKATMSANDVSMSNNAFEDVYYVVISASKYKSSIKYYQTVG